MKTLILLFCIFSVCFTSISQTYNIGSITHLSGTSGLSAIDANFEDSRVQYIYTAAELSASGMPSDFEIQSFHMALQELPGADMNSFTISMKNTATDSYGATPSFDEGLTTVYSTGTVVPSDFTVNVWKEFDLQTSFTWDGTSHLLIQICYDNPNGAAFADQGVIYGYLDGDGVNRTSYNVADGSSGCTLSAGNVSTFKPYIGLEKLCTTPNVSYQMNHNPAICSGSEVFSLSGSQVGVNYKLFDWTDTQIGATISGTGSPIDLPAVSATDIYYVNAEGTGTICAGPYTMKEGDDFHFISMTAYNDPSNLSAGDDATICEIASHSLSSTVDVNDMILFTENFETSLKFNITNGGDNSGTTGNSTWYRETGVYDNGTIYARVNSDGYGSFDMDESLITPEFDASNMSAVSLSFDQNLRIWSDEIASVDVWNGSAWVTVESYTADQGDNTTPTPSNKVLDLTDYKNDRMKLRFRYYNANFEYYWIIDNIIVSGTPSTNYSWDNESSLSNASIGNPDATPDATTTYTLTVSANGCSATDEVLISVEPEPTITSTSVTNETLCGAYEYTATTDALDGSGEWTNTQIGGFSAATMASTTFQTNTFDTDITLTWTQNTGVCASSQAEVIVRFNQPNESLENLDESAWMWGGLTDTDWQTSSNWYNWDGSKWLRKSLETPSSSDRVYVLPNSSAGLCVSATNVPIASAANISDLILASGATIDLESVTSVSGNLTNNGTINTSINSTLEFIGASDQTVSGNSTDLNNMTVNKSTGSLIVITPITVSGTLTMTQGNIENGQPIVIGTSSSNTGNLIYSNGIVTGELRRYFSNATGSKFFPIGTNSRLRDVTVDFSESPGTNQYLTASYRTGTPQDDGTTLYQGLPLITSDNQLIQNYSEDGYWEINPTGDDYSSAINSTQYTIDLHMNNISNAVGFTSSNEYQNVRVIKSAGSNTPSLHHKTWTALSHVEATGVNSDFVLTASSKGFSVFNGGNNNGDALPVELLSFNGTCHESNIELSWNTSSEFNSSHFDLEYSRDGEYWSVISSIAAAGFSNELIEYSFIHENVPSEHQYYRLVQVDLDGITETYNAIAISCASTESYFDIYPNPSDGQFQIIFNDPQILGASQITLVDAMGSTKYRRNIDIREGINTFMMSDNLDPGMYYVVISNGKGYKNTLKHIVR